jgi:surface polysaccharide O-acyltransferase-like enzyme
MAQGARNGSVDLLRGLAVVGIVWFHAHAPGADLALAGLTVFFLLLFYYAPGLKPPVGLTIAARADRLLRPWLFWSAIYGVAKLAQAIVGGVPLATEFEPWMVLTGTALHLWFLPFAFLCLLVLGLIESLIDLTSSAGFAVALALSGVALPLSVAIARLDLDHPWSEWGAALGSVGMGLALRGTNGSRVRYLWLLAAACIGTVLSWWLDAALPLRIPLAVAATVTALSVTAPSTALTRWIGWVAMPVYLIHPLVLAPLLPIMAGWPVAVPALAAVLMSAVAGTAILLFGQARRLF